MAVETEGGRAKYRRAKFSSSTGRRRREENDEAVLPSDFRVRSTKLVVPAIGRVALGGFWSLQRRIATSDVQLRLPELQRSIIFGFGATATFSRRECRQKMNDSLTEAFGSRVASKGETPQSKIPLLEMDSVSAKLYMMPATAKKRLNMWEDPNEFTRFRLKKSSGVNVVIGVNTKPAKGSMDYKKNANYNCPPQRGGPERDSLNRKREYANQILKVALAINSVSLSEIEVPESYLLSLPKDIEDTSMSQMAIDGL
ncbi:PRONE domain-containing protein [Artemisia annua]|uniref:PRONE domain-containing protein n=1 Tax=Artemisia annua TaxID=35608 RepID=A0A2U1N2B9_ARTAN|nr:PRONE domain-containing protein [Artemisia annua]